jgi:hypothetical protein
VKSTTRSRSGGGCPTPRRRNPKWRRHKSAVLDQLRRRFEAGDANAPLQALHWCLGFNESPPGWVRAYAIVALQRYWSWEAESLDAAFGVKRSTDPRTLRAQRKAPKLRGLVAERVLKARAAGRGIDADLFEEIARDLGISTTNTRQHWATVRKAMGFDDVVIPRKKKKRD